MKLQPKGRSITVLCHFRPMSTFYLGWNIFYFLYPLFRLGEGFEIARGGGGVAGGGGGGGQLCSKYTCDASIITKLQLKSNVISI